MDSQVVIQLDHEGMRLGISGPFLTHLIEIRGDLAAHLAFDPAHIVVNAFRTVFVHVSRGLSAGNPVQAIAPRGSKRKSRNQFAQIFAAATGAYRVGLRGPGI